MSERDLSNGAARAARSTGAASDGGLGGMFTMLETSALVLSAFTLFLLYQLEATQAAANRSVSSDVWLFMPHIFLIALIVAGFRRVSAIAATFLLLGGCLFGLAACLNSISGSRDAEGMGFASVLQLPIFILCFYSAREPFSLTELSKRGPRVALGAVVAGIGWFGATQGISRANAPYRERMAAVDAARQRETARRDARSQVGAIAACMQRVPVTADSQPIFPAALSDLPSADCPDASRPAPTGFVIEYVPGSVDSAGHHRSFTLRAHDAQMSDSARTYEIDESMILAEWYGHDVRRPLMSSASRMEMLAQVARCIEQGRDTVSSPAGTTYPPSIAALARADRCDAKANADSSAMFVPRSSGLYVVRYTAPPAPRPDDAPAGYTLSIEPRRDSSGRASVSALLSFYVDTSGIVHLSRRARAATEDDPALPDCPSYEERSRMPDRALCREWVPRQRWGLTSQLPTISLSRSGSGTVGAGETLFLIPLYQPMVASDSMVEAHIQWDTTLGDSTLHRHAGHFGEPLGNGVVIRLQHAYADTGMKHYRFRVRTATGEQYESHDSVRVLLARQYR